MALRGWCSGRRASCAALCVIKIVKRTARQKLLVIVALSLFANPSQSDETKNPSTEDYALLALLDNLAVSHFLSLGETGEIRKLTDTNIHRHIAALRKLGGSITDPKWKESKIRALNAIGILWKENPPEPLADADQEWNELVEANKILVKWAMKECENHAEYECRH